MTHLYHPQTKNQLDAVRYPKTGKRNHIPALIIDHYVWDTVENHLLSRGEFCYRDRPEFGYRAYYYYDHVNKNLIAIARVGKRRRSNAKGSPMLTDLLCALGLLPGQRHTRMVTSCLIEMALCSTRELSAEPTPEQPAK